MSNSTISNSEPSLNYVSTQPGEGLTVDLNNHRAFVTGMLQLVQEGSVCYFSLPQRQVILNPPSLSVAYVGRIVQMYLANPLPVLRKESQLIATLPDQMPDVQTDAYTIRFYSRPYLLERW